MLDSKYIYGGQIGPGARLTGMISGLNQSSTALLDLELSFHGHIGGPIILLGIMF